MKTLLNPVYQNDLVRTAAKPGLIATLLKTLTANLAALAAVTTAASLVMLSVWAAGLGFNGLVGAATLGLAFVFLGLAVDSRGPATVLLWVTGLSLPVLAWLQFNVSADFTIVSGVIVAAWVAAVLFRRLR